MQRIRSKLMDFNLPLDQDDRLIFPWEFPGDPDFIIPILVDDQRPGRFIIAGTSHGDQNNNWEVYAFPFNPDFTGHFTFPDNHQFLGTVTINPNRNPLAVFMKRDRGRSAPRRLMFCYRSQSANGVTWEAPMDYEFVGEVESMLEPGLSYRMYKTPPKLEEMISHDAVYSVM